MQENRIYTKGWEDYELIDAGGGKKLERWGSIITIRPEVQAYFKSKISFADWEKQAHWEFREGKGKTGKWSRLNQAPDNWQIRYKRLVFQLELTKFKHVGLFPEQRINWDYISDKLNSESKMLNLFAYTGAASLMARQKGADTFHVDSVTQLITWAKANMELSRLLNIHWVHEDALKFALREVKRGNKYDVIVMDPPAWGIGAKNEKWKLEDKIDVLLSAARDLLNEEGSLVLNTYSPTITLEYLRDLSMLYFDNKHVELKELWMKTSTGSDLFYGNLMRVS